MKSHWLRGVLLGVSLALLLASGVALAQGTLAADKECVECVPGRYEGVPVRQIPERYGVTIRGVGWSPGVLLYHELRFPNGDSWIGQPGTDDSGRFTWGSLAFTCELCAEPLAESGYGAGALAVHAIECPPVLGEMEFYFEDPRTEHDASIYVLLAETCEEAVEAFVPEPGTLMLLGTGLAGLAGYATLRWRTRR